MGAKSSSAPAPDPRLVDAQIHSMGVQDDAISRVLANTEQLAPLQRQQMQFGLDAARTAYDQGQEDRKYALDMRDKYTAAIDPLVNEARQFNQEDRRNTLMGEANADITQAFGSARGQQLRDLARVGVNPADGRYAGLHNQMDMNEALAKVLAGRKVSEAARAEGLQLKSNAANILSGFPSMASGLGATGASLGMSGLTAVNSGLSGLNAGFSAAGSMAGAMGSNATGMWNAEANYKNQQDQLASANDPFNTILGIGSGLAMKKWLF